MVVKLEVQCLEVGVWCNSQDVQDKVLIRRVHKSIFKLSNTYMNERLIY